MEGRGEKAGDINELHRSRLVSTIYLNQCYAKIYDNHPTVLLMSNKPE